MFVRIPLWVRVPLIWLLVAANTVLRVSLLLLCAFFKAVLPIKALQRVLERWIIALAEAWIAGNSGMIQHLTSLKINYSEDAALDAKGHYLVLSNHQSSPSRMVISSSPARSHEPSVDDRTR